VRWATRKGFVHVYQRYLTKLIPRGVARGSRSGLSPFHSIPFQSLTHSRVLISILLCWPHRLTRHSLQSRGWNISSVVPVTRLTFESWKKYVGSTIKLTMRFTSPAVLAAAGVVIALFAPGSTCAPVERRQAITDLDVLQFALTVSLQLAFPASIQILTPNTAGAPRERLLQKSIEPVHRVRLQCRRLQLAVLQQLEVHCPR
jgi:hypothetical protein